MKFAMAAHDACISGGLLRKDSSLDLDVAGVSIAPIVDSRILDVYREEYAQKRVGIVEMILFSRYANLHNLLRVRDRQG